MNAMWIQLKDNKTKKLHIINFSNIDFIQEENAQVYIQFNSSYTCLRLNVSIGDVEKAIWSATARLTM